MSRLGDYIGTYTGKQFYPIDPQPDDVCIEDIAHALSQICRFNGHTKSMYDVASHSCNVQMILDKWNFNVEVQLYGLLHDAHEAYIADITRPLANCLSQTAKIEIKEMKANVQRAIYRRFGLIEPSSQMDFIIKCADDYALALEAREYMANTSGWDLVKVKDEDSLWYPYSSSEVTFLMKFNNLLQEAKRR